MAPGLIQAGRAHRGGLGAVYEIELLEESATAFLFGERGKFALAVSSVVVMGRPTVLL